MMMEKMETMKMSADEPMFNEPLLYFVLYEVRSAADLFALGPSVNSRLGLLHIVLLRVGERSGLHT